MSTDNVKERTRYQLLRVLQKAPTSLWGLFGAQDASLPEAIRMITTMLTNKEIVFDGEHRKFSVHNDVPILSEVNGLCPTCEGKGIVLSDRFEETLKQFSQLTADRPPPDVAYNQGIIDSRDLALKAAFMDRRGDLEGRSVLLLGDDDLFSIFLASLGLSCRPMVLEIDDRFIRYINEKSDRHGLEITAKHYDVNTPLPDELHGACHVFVTEPPEGIKGMRLFLERAAEAIPARGSGYFGLTTLESSLAKWLVIQRFLVERRMVITDLLRNFSLYPESGDPVEDYAKFPISEQFPVHPGAPDVDYFRSSLIRIEKTEQHATEDSGGLYTDKDTWVTLDPEREDAG
jgi:predicted methyltransferase